MANRSDHRIHDDGDNRRRAFPSPVNRALLTLGFVLYAVALVFAARRWELPALDGRAWIFLALAAVAEFGAKILFGMQFRLALARQGRQVTLKAATAAALVGAAAARMLPAGGALTPTAMAWAVRTEEEQTAGAALRTTVTSYGGLLLLTGLAMGWGASTGRHPLIFTGAVVAAVLLTAVGLFVLVGSRWLPRVVRMLPARLRKHFAPTADGGYLSPAEIGLIVARIASEAAVLWAALSAFHIHLTPSQTMVAFGLSTLVGGLPATPGGIGLVEGGLVGVLAVFGFSPRLVVAPVLVYRIIDYWIAGAAGLAAANWMSRKTRHAASASR